jgi:hypothetical protein
MDTEADSPPDTASSAASMAPERPSEIALVAIADLAIGDSPRLSGIDRAEVQSLVAADRSSLPAIVVERATMRVFDGLHRLAAAKLRGDGTIRVRFVDGEHAAFVTAVHNNAVHGRRLTLEERQAAADRILRSHPRWSDRKVAEVANLSRPGVAKIRARSSGNVTQLNWRTGRDGRSRPVRAHEGRQRVARLLAYHPGATIRELAAGAGVALGTAKDVRDRVRRGEPATPTDRSKRRPATPDECRAYLTEREILSVLVRDPSLIQREPCRKFVQWLALCAVRRDSLDELVSNIPPHLVELVAQLAGTYADTWCRLAAKLAAAAQHEDEGRPGLDGTGA